MEAMFQAKKEMLVGLWWGEEVRFFTLLAV